MEIPFEQACALVGGALQGEVRREIIAGLSAKSMGKALLELRDAMRANRFRAVGQQIFLDRLIRSYDGRTRAEGFHILHDWDGVSQQTNPDIIPIDVLHFIAEQRGADPANAAELAILLDYYFMHVLSLLTLRVWDDGDANENLARVEAMLADLQGPYGSGQQFAGDAETLLLIGTSHYEPEEWGYGKLLAKVRTLDDGRVRGFVSAVSFRDVDFRFAVAPWLRPAQRPSARRFSRPAVVAIRVAAAVRRSLARS